MKMTRRQLLAAAGAGVVAAAIDVGGLRSPAIAAGRSVEQAADTADPTPTPAWLGPADLTTLRSTVLIGPAGAGGYALLVAGGPELHTIRGDLGGAPNNPTFAIAAFAQMTDLHVVDDQSPLRVEFLDQYANPGPPHYASYPFNKAYRPHESLSTQVVDAMCRAIQRVGHGPQTNLPLAFTVVTGDAVDNAQYNEVRWYIDLLDGGRTITPNSGSPVLDHSVTSDAMGLDINYWHPANKSFELSNDRGHGLDLYFQAGFPEVLQMPYAARRAFTSHGIGMPWYAVFGNHDALVQGNVPVDNAFLDFFSINVRDFAVGSFKPSGLLGLPDRYTGSASDIFDLVEVGLFHDMPGLSDIPADNNRRLLVKHDFIAEHFTTTGTPVGHGLPAPNGFLDAFYVINPGPSADLVRHIVLDTPNVAGGAGGIVSDRQFSWLQQQLLADSSRYLGTDGSVRTQPGVADRLIIIYSHHTLDTMHNYWSTSSVHDHRDPNPPQPAGAHNGDELKALLLRFPNVIMHVNGHNHKNRVSAWARPPGSAIPGGFWEVSTAAHIDWPEQSRLFDITAGRGTISIFTTMVDIEAPLSYGNDTSNPRVLAALSRELAANDIQERGDGTTKRRGTGADRNTQLLLPAPFPLPDPHVFGSPVAAAVNKDGRAELYGVGADGTVYHRAQIAGTGFDLPHWDGSAWSVLAGPAMRSIAAATNADGRVELFGLDQLERIFHRVQASPNTWDGSSWAPMDGLLTSVAMARNADGRLEVFGTNVADAVFHRAQASPGSWAGSSWQQLDGALTQVAAAADSQSGIVHLFGVDAGGRCFQRVQTSAGSWANSGWSTFASAPTDLFGSLGPMTTISAGTQGGDRISVFATKGHGQIFQWQQESRGSTRYVGPRWFDGAMTQLCVNSLMALELYGINADGRVFVRAQNNILDSTSWSGWTEFGGSLRPVLAARSAPVAGSPGPVTTSRGNAVDLRLSATGGTAPYTWAVSGLPAGLSADTTGHITGVPTTAVSTVTATVTDYSGLSSGFSFTWTVTTQVPNVLSWDQQGATNEINAAGLAVGTIKYTNNCVDPGSVMVQHPQVGTVVPVGSTVDLTISTCDDPGGGRGGK